MTPGEVLQILANAVQLLLVVMALAFIIERLVEHLYTVAQGALPSLPKWVKGVAAIVMGLPLGLLLTFDPFRGLFINEWVGKALSGMLIGAGSNLVHEVYRKLLEILALKKGEPG